jgi:ATP-dependent DNA ligase
MREFRKTTGRSVRPLVWRIGVDPTDPEAYVVRWGVLNGAMQETKDIPGACGVEGHADYQTAEEYVDFCIDREIRKKNEQGYIEYIDGEPVGKVACDIDFAEPLPKNLCFFKPKKEISDKKLKKLDAEGKIVWTLKRDGMMHISVKRQGTWEIYSRRIDLVTDHYPHVVESLETLDLPDNTILLGEMCLLNDDGSDNFLGISSICRSKTDLALAYQGLADFPKRKKDKKVLDKVCYYVFDIAFYNGADLISNETTLRRLIILKEIFEKLDKRLRVNTGRKATKELIIKESKLRESMLRKHFIAPVKIYYTSAEDDLELAKSLRAEGFVALDVTAKYGDRAYSFDGKAQRPSGIWKRKPSYEDEFIITGWYKGTGRNRDRLGGFTIAQYHPDTGELLDCGKCGGGLSDKQREEFFESGDKMINQTIKIEFDSRQPPNGDVHALRFPEYKGHADKSIDECIAQEDWPPKGVK